MAYKSIDELFWRDPEIRCLDHQSRYLLIYLMTNPHSHYSGLYYLPESVIPEETGLSTQQVNESLSALCTPSNRMGIDTLSKENYDANLLGNAFDEVSTVKINSFLLRDAIHHLIWVKSMLLYPSLRLSYKQLKGVANHLSCLPKSFLVPMFLDHYRHLDISLFLPESYGIPRFSKNRQEKEKEKETVKEKEQGGGARSTSENNEHRNNGKDKGTSKGIMAMTDPEFIGWLKAQPAYEDIDIDHFIAKLSAWCQAKGKKLTRMRIINNLNREDKPLKQAGTWEDAFK